MWQSLWESCVGGLEAANRPNGGRYWIVFPSVNPEARCWGTMTTALPSDRDRVQLLGMALQAPNPERIAAYHLVDEGSQPIDADACGPIVVGHDVQSSCWVDDHAPTTGCCFLEVESPSFVSPRSPIIRPRTVEQLAHAILTCAARPQAIAGIDSRFADRHGCRIVYLLPRVAKTMATTIWLTQADLEGARSMIRSAM